MTAPPRPTRTRLRALWRWCELPLVGLVAAGTGLCFGLRDAAVPWTSLVFYATPLPLLVFGSAVGASLAWLRRGRGRAVAWACLALVLLGLTLRREVFRAPPVPEGEAALRVVAWNLHGGSAGQARVQAALAELDGDLVCLSEVGHYADLQRGFFHELAGALRARGYVLRSWPGARLLIAIRAGEGQLKSHRAERVAGVTRTLWVRARWRGRPLRVALADFRSLPTLDRRPGTEALLTRLDAEPGPWICLGDFNTPLASRCFDPWRASGSQHAFEAAGAGYAPTWPAPLPVLTLDHLWARGLVPLRAEAPIRAESDHCPLVVSLAWGEGARPR